MRSLVCTLAICIAICTGAQAIVTSDGLGTHVVNEMDDTFGLNLAGVVTFGGYYNERLGSFCTGTLITDRHVVTAAHCFDSDGDLKLDPDNFIFPSDLLVEMDGDWVTVDYDPAKVRWSEKWEISRSDIAVVTLEADAPPDVPRYALYGGKGEIGQPFILAGYGETGFGNSGVDSNDPNGRGTKRAGLNQYDSLAVVEGAQFLVADFDSGQPHHNSMGDLGFGADEVGTADGDSGGPGFLNGAVASVVAFGEQFALVDATEEFDSSWGERDFHTRVSNFKDFILTATDGQAIFVFPDQQSVLGDFDNDQLLTAGDMDLLSRAIRFGIDHASFDLNDDGNVNQLDRQTWVHDLVGSLLGDANLDGEVGMDDFLALSAAFGVEAGWENGDFDGSYAVEFADFLILSEHFGQPAMQGALTQVPEPSASSWALILGLVLVYRNWLGQMANADLAEGTYFGRAKR